MTADTLFKNFLASTEITNTRLGNFATTAVSRFTVANENRRWTATIDMINAALPDFMLELADIDVGRNIGLGNTDNTDAVITAFSKRMHDEEPFIARLLGGRNSAEYLQFYPHGTKEYSHVTKTDAPALMTRVAKATVVNANALGQPLQSDLTNYQTSYEAMRTLQTGNQGAVKGHLSLRTDKRKALELVMLRAIFQVGDANPGDVQGCGQYFDFSSLYAPVHGSATPPTPLT